MDSDADRKRSANENNDEYGYSKRIRRQHASDSEQSDDSVDISDEITSNNLIHRSTTNSPQYSPHHRIDPSPPATRSQLELVPISEIPLVTEQDREFVQIRATPTNQLLKWHQQLNEDVETFSALVDELKKVLPEDATLDEYTNATSRETLIGYTDEFGRVFPGLWPKFVNLIDSPNEDYRDTTLKFRRLEKILQIEPRHFVNEILLQISKRFEIPLLGIRIRLLEGQHIMNDHNSSAVAFEKQWEQKLLSLRFLLESYVSYRGCYINLHRNPDTFPGVFAFGTLYFTCKDGRKQKKDMSQLIMTAMLQLQMRGAKKRPLDRNNLDGQNVELVFPKLVDGNFVHYYEPLDEKKPTIFDWVRGPFASRMMESGYFGPSFDLVTSTPHIFKSVANWLAAFDSEIVPEVCQSRNVLAAPNGLYCTQNISFYTWDELKDPNCDFPVDLSIYSAMNYIKNPFPLRLREIPVTDWPTILTEATDQIFRSQRFDQDVRIIIWLWCFIGRNFFWLRDVYGEGWEFALGLIGCSRTGKSLLIRMILSFFQPSQVAFLSNNCQKQFVLEAFLNAWLLASFELDKDIAGSFSVTDMFMIVSGETGPVSRKFKVAVNIEFRIPFVFAGNDIPTFSKPGTINADKGDAIAARLLICKMAWSIPKNMLDTTLFSRMQRENWEFLHKACCAYHSCAFTYHKYSIWSSEVNLPKHFTNANAEVKSATHPLIAYFDNAQSDFKYSPITTADHETTYVAVDFFLATFKKWCSENGYPTNFRWEPSFYSTPFANFGLTVSPKQEEKENPNNGNKLLTAKWIYGLHIKTEVDSFQDRIVNYVNKEYVTDSSSSIPLATFKKDLEEYMKDRYEEPEEKLKLIMVNNLIFCNVCNELGLEHSIKRDAGTPTTAQTQKPQQPPTSLMQNSTKKNEDRPMIYGIKKKPIALVQ